MSGVACIGDSAGRGLTVGTPLPRKLGLSSPKPGPHTVTLMGEPIGFHASLCELPESVHLNSQLGCETTLAICFVRSVTELHAVLELVALQLPPAASAWIAHPKQHLKPGFDQNDVRAAGLAHGLVDYKICSIDNAWSGIKFARRKVPQHAKLEV